MFIKLVIYIKQKLEPRSYLLGSSFHKQNRETHCIYACIPVYMYTHTYIHTYTYTASRTRKITDILHKMSFLLLFCKPLQNNHIFHKGLLLKYIWQILMCMCVYIYIYIHYIYIYTLGSLRNVNDSK